VPALQCPLFHAGCDLPQQAVPEVGTTVLLCIPLGTRSASCFAEVLQSPLIVQQANLHTITLFQLFWLHTRMHTNTHTYTCTYTNACTRTYIHIQVHVHVHKYTHSHTRSLTIIHTHAHTLLLAGAMIQAWRFNGQTWPCQVARHKRQTSCPEVPIRSVRLCCMLITSKLV